MRAASAAFPYRLVAGCRPALLLCAAIVAAACSPTYDWREVRPEGTALMLLMPCKPDRREQAGLMVAGGPADVAVWSCRAGEASFSVTRASLVDPGRVTPVADGLREALLARPGTRRLDRAAYDVPGATPYVGATSTAFETPAPDGHAVSGRVAVFVHGLTVLQLVLLADRPLPAEVGATFFTSPRLSTAGSARP